MPSRTALLLLSLTPLGFKLAVRCGKWPVPGDVYSTFVQHWQAPESNTPEPSAPTEVKPSDTGRKLLVTARKAMAQLRRLLKNALAANKELTEVLELKSKKLELLEEHVRVLQRTMAALEIEKELRNANRQLALRRVLAGHCCSPPISGSSSGSDSHMQLLTQ